MGNKVIVGFEVSDKRKAEMVNAAENYMVDKINVPLTLSQFCRLSVENMLNNIRK